MDTKNKKLLQYLYEAHASERGLTRVLQSQIAVAPRGTYRRALEAHLGETRSHAERLEDRIRALGGGFGGLVHAGVGLAESIAAQALAVGKTPFDLLRGSGGEEKVLKNAKDACATEALEIATYTAIEQLARSVGDDETARLAASIRTDEERMLQKLRDELPRLTAAVVGADVRGDGTYDVSTTGAADATRSAARRGRATAKRTQSSARRTARKTGRAAAVTQPWPGYDKQTAEEIAERLAGSDEDRRRTVRTYERAHKDRATIIAVTEREPAGS